MVRQVLRALGRVWVTPLSLAVVVFAGVDAAAMGSLGREERVAAWGYVLLSASLLAVAGWLVLRVLAFCARRIKRAVGPEAWAWRLGVGLAAGIPAFGFGRLLASGRGITASGWSPVVVAVVVVSLVTACLALVESLARAPRWPVNRRVGTALACIAAAGGSVAITTFHATTYLRVHRGFLLCASILLQLGFEIAVRTAPRRRKGTRTTLALGAASMALLVATSCWLSRAGGLARPGIGLVVFARTVAAQKMTELLFSISPIYPRGLPANGAVWLKGTRLAPSHPPVVKPLPPGKAAGYNVVFFSADALRADAIGRKLSGVSSTPHLDQLQARSIVFNDAVADFSHTEQSLLSLLAGKWDLGRGSRTRVDFRRERELDRRRLAGTFARGGYFTIANMMGGRWGQAFFDARHIPGFASHVQPGPTCDAQVDDWARFLDRYDEPRPFFLWMHVFDTHRPAPHRDRSVSDRGARDLYEAAVRGVDACVGRMIATLQKAGRWDKTVFVFFADHGEALGEHGRTRMHSTCYWHDIHVPVLFRVPGFEPRRVPYRIQLSDLLPTVANLVGVSLGTEALDGSDLSGLLGGPRGPEPRGMAFSAGHPKQYACASVVSESWHLIYTARAGLYELYDIDRDPAETRNLISSHPQAFALLRPLLDAYAARVAVGAPATPDTGPDLAD
jgi:hypothetical protein